MHVLGLRVWITATQPGASFTDEQYKVIQMIVCDYSQIYFALTVHQNYSQSYFAKKIKTYDFDELNPSCSNICNGIT